MLGSHSRRTRGALVLGLALTLGLVGLLLARSGSGATTRSAAANPVLVRDVKTGRDRLGSLTPPAPDPIQDYVQPDTQI